MIRVLLRQKEGRESLEPAPPMVFQTEQRRGLRAPPGMVAMRLRRFLFAEEL